MNKLKISSYSAPDAGSKVGEFDLQINPISINIERTTGKNGINVFGASGLAVATRTRVAQPASIKFSFTLDNTGVIPTPLTETSITQCISQLENLCVENKSTSNQNPFVKLTWGNTFEDLNFGQVQKFEYDYNFFDSNGNPLRVVVQLHVQEVTPFSQSSTPSLSSLEGGAGSSLSSAFNSTTASAASSEESTLRNSAEGFISSL